MVLKAATLIPPTEDELKDRSKGDALSKTIVLGQTVWFVTQCLARWIQNIAVTELEVITLAYTLVIFLMYIAWWNKPLSVDQPVAIPASSDKYADWKRHQETSESDNDRDDEDEEVHLFPQWLQKVLDVFVGM